MNLALNSKNIGGVLKMRREKIFFQTYNKKKWMMLLYYDNSIKRRSITAQLKLNPLSTLFVIENDQPIKINPNYLDKLHMNKIVDTIYYKITHRRA